MSSLKNIQVESGPALLRLQQLSDAGISSAATPALLNSDFRAGMSPNGVKAEQLNDFHKLLESFEIRYLVYCLDRGFLPAESYPDRLEMDAYDQYSLHFGALNEDSEMIGTVRLVQHSDQGFPMDDYWTDVVPSHLVEKCAEISRLAVPRQVGRNAAGYVIPADDGECLRLAKEDSRFSFTVTMELYIAIYRAAKQNGVTHLLAAMEKSLARLLSRYHFPFEQIGDEVDYYGQVTPFILDLDALDKSLAAKAPRLYERFQEGLEIPPLASSQERLVS